MSKPKVLYVAQNHPEVRPGGAEGYALDLYDAMREIGEFEPIFCARTGPPISEVKRYVGGSPFTSVNDDPNQYFFWTDLTNYDWFYGRPADKSILFRFFRDFLLAHRPDVIHFQHTLFIGYEAVRVARQTLPDTPIVYMLHEYLPICHRDGQMVRTKSEELCQEETPHRCHECFPETSPQTFFARKRFIQSQLASRRPLHRTRRVRARPLRRLGHPGRQDQGRSVRMLAGRAGQNARPASQPLRLLRPVHALQGR